MNLWHETIFFLANAAGQPEAADPGAVPAGAGGYQTLHMLLVLVAFGMIFYFLVWRPESRRRKEKQSMLDALKPKDKVETIGGLIGSVVEVEKDAVVLLVDPRKDIRIRFRREAVGSVERAAEEDGKADKDGRENGKK